MITLAPTYNAKLYAASQTFDEARHVEVFNRYLQEKIGMHYPLPEKPDQKFNVKKFFGIDSDLEVKGFKKKTQWVPDIDETYNETCEQKHLPS